MLSALTMSAAFSHLLELGPKKGFDAGLYVKLHRTLYPNYGRVAGMAEFLAVLSSMALALRERRRFEVAGAGLLPATHGVFYALVHPANRTMAAWPLDQIPADWTRWRDQWEYSHAARAALVDGGGGRAGDVGVGGEVRISFMHRSASQLSSVFGESDCQSGTKECGHGPCSVGTFRDFKLAGGLESADLSRGCTKRRDRNLLHSARRLCPLPHQTGLA
jgi:hypothetical protein